MCQQGQNEITHYIKSEKEKIYQTYEAYQRGEVTLSDEELKDMAVRMMMLRDAS